MYRRTSFFSKKVPSKDAPLEDADADHDADNTNTDDEHAQSKRENNEEDPPQSISINLDLEDFLTGCSAPAPVATSLQPRTPLAQLGRKRWPFDNLHGLHIQDLFYQIYFNELWRCDLPEPGTASRRTYNSIWRFIKLAKRLLPENTWIHGRVPGGDEQDEQGYKDHLLELSELLANQVVEFMNTARESKSSVEGARKRKLRTFELKVSSAFQYLREAYVNQELPAPRTVNDYAIPTWFEQKIHVMDPEEHANFCRRFKRPRTKKPLDWGDE